MPLAHFTVSQIRSAAACPRILYFDGVLTRDRQLKYPSVSRIWKAGKDDESTACGSLFHAAVERFNGQALRDPVVRQLLGMVGDSSSLAQKLLAHVYRQYVNREAL